MSYPRETSPIPIASDQDIAQHYLRNQWLILFISLLTFASLIAYLSFSSYQEVTDQEKIRLQTQTHVISSNLERQLDATNKALISIIRDQAFLSGDEYVKRANRRMQALSDAMPGIRTMLLLDDRGVVTASNRAELLTRDFSSRDYFAIPAKENNPQTLYVSPPFKTVLGVFVINISRTIQSPDGAFNGVVTASLDPDYFKVLLGSVLYAPDMKSAITHGDGIRFMSIPESSGDAGRNLALPGSFILRHMKSGAEESIFSGNGSSRMEVIRTVHPQGVQLNRPIYVECARDTASIYKSWRSTTLMQLLLFVGISAASLFGLTILQRRQKTLTELVEQSQGLMEIRLRLLDLAATCDTKDFLRQALDEICNQCDSPVGFYHFIEADQQTISLQAWSTGTLNQFCSAKDIGIHYPIDKAGVWAESVRQRKPVIHNDYAAVAGSNGLPKEDAPMIRELVVPIIRSGLVVATMAVGNKVSDYTERDLKLATILADLVWESVERKQIEERYSLMAMIVEQSPVSVVMTDTDAKITYVNHYFEELTGYSMEEAKGSNPRILKTEFTSPEIFSEIWRHLKSGYDWEGELCNKKKDGSLYWERAHLFPVFDNSGVIINFAGIKEDITERKQQEAELLRAKCEAEAANRAKSEFLANMSHEIRTPMNAIIGISYLALKTNLDPQQHDYLVKIRNAADSLLGIVNDVLDFSKIEAGKLDFECVDFSLSELLEKIGDQVAINAEERGNKIIFAIAPEVPPLLVGDPLRLSQILNNLVSNAVKFTEHGEIVISAELASPLEAEGAIAITFKISDTGIGMNEEQIGRIFAPFVQADTSTTRKYGGTGLGLAIVKSLVEQMGGTLQVESEQGVGSKFSFTVTLELINDRSNTGKAFTERDNRMQGDIKTISGAHILVVEDNSINQQIMLELLSQIGITAECANNGQEAVGMVASSARFDAILMDLQMPVMDGYEATRLIRRIKSIEELPIIAITAYAMEKDQERCLTSGMNGHISKPINPDELYAAMTKWIQFKKWRESLNKISVKKSYAAKTTEPQELTAIPGINMGKVLARLGNNKELLRTILLEFCTRHNSSTEEIRQALKQEDKTKALFLAHSLKGVAGNIGAESLAATVLSFEEAARSDDRELISALLDDMQQQITEIVAAVESLKSSVGEETEIGNPPAIDKVTLEQDIRELYELLRCNKISALDKFKHLKQLCPGRNECRELERLINAFDFKAAQQLLVKLASAMGISVKE